MAVSISFDLVLTLVLKVATALGTEYSATSVALMTYQSVGVNNPDASCFIISFFWDFKPLTLTSPTSLSSGKSPLSESSCVHKESAIAFAVAVP